MEVTKLILTKKALRYIFSSDRFPISVYALRTHYLTDAFYLNHLHVPPDALEGFHFKKTFDVGESRIIIQYFKIQTDDLRL
jgi:hypothetical protein